MKIVSDGLFNAATRYGIPPTPIGDISDIAVMRSSNSVTGISLSEMLVSVFEALEDLDNRCDT